MTRGPSISSVLVPQAIGLLLEDLGLDDTLTAKDSIALVQELAALRDLSDDRTRPVSELLATQLELGAALLQARMDLIEEARLLGLEVSQAQIVGAQQILGRASQTGVLIDLQGLPVEGEPLALHTFDFEHRRLEHAAVAVRHAWQELGGRVLPSAMTDLDLAAEAFALRKRGRLPGRVFRAGSSRARERVKPHLAPMYREISASDMATVLDRARVHEAARRSLAGAVAKSHPWVRWTVNRSSGEVYERRAASVRWILTEAAAGNLGVVERTLLTDASWRRVLTGQAGVRLSKALRRSSDVMKTASLGSVVAAALDRFARWMTHLPHVTTDEFTELGRVLNLALPQISAALLLVQDAQAEPALHTQAKAVIARRQAAFGPGDENRPLFRVIVSQVREGVRSAQSLVGPLRPQHQHLVALVSDVREAHELMLGDLQDTAPPRGPLRVAIVGRTKAGKTTLRKVLTRDLTEDGIGRGAHRTTRTADVFGWDQLTFVDTPGVAAKDDDFDAEVAERACRDADAVVWMFAESLHEEEAQILQALLTVKPVLVVYNAKGRVDSEVRLSRFSRYPRLSFADEEGHAQRSRQMARAAGVRSPLFLAVHAGAARRALLAGGESHPAWSASRIPHLESELHRVLASQAQGLRSLRLADQVRTPLLVAGGRAGAVVDALGPRCATLGHRIAQEERDLRAAVVRAADHARARVHRNFAAVSAALPGWLKKVAGRSDSRRSDFLDREWSMLLADLDIHNVLADMAESLSSDARASGLLLDQEDQLEERLQRSRFGATAHQRISMWARAWRFLRRLAGSAVRNAPRFREKASMGRVGWIALAVDVLATTGRAVAEEVTASRIDRQAWEQNAHQASRRELERVRQRVARELDSVEAALIASVNGHFSRSREEVSKVVESLAATARWQADVGAAVAEIDRLTVERLVQLGGLPRGEVVAVDRVPNRHLRVTVVGDPEVVSRWLSSVLDGCSSEAITVTGKHPKGRRPKELEA